MGAPALNLPSTQEVDAAQAAVDALRGLDLHGQPTRVRLASPDRPDEVEVILPAEALHLLLRILTHMASGHAVTVMPVEAELTTQQAADLLGVSRPYLVRLLDDGVIAHHKVGTHRRVKAVDVIEYKKRDDADRRSALDELAAEAQALDLGY